NHDCREDDSERHHRCTGVTIHPVQEVPYGKQYRRRIPQEMDPARGQRANATDGHELDQTGHRRKGAHDDPKSHSEARAQNRSLVAQKARSVTSAPTRKPIGKTTSMGWIGWPKMAAV